ALDAGHGDETWSGPAVFVGIAEADDRGLTLALKQVDPEDAHPTEVLPYLEVPDEWLAFGVLAYGWVTSLDLPARPRERVRTVELFDRTGGGVAIVRRQGGSPEVISHQPGDGNDPIGE